MDEMDEEGEAAMAMLEAEEERELSVHDAIAELQRRGARPAPGAPMPSIPPPRSAGSAASPSASAALPRSVGAAAASPFPGAAPLRSVGSAAGAGPSGATSSRSLPPPNAAPAETGTCIECLDANSQAKFYGAYGLHVCFDCQRANRGPGKKYQVITKSKAKDEFLLNDRQLDETRGGLGNIRLPNPNDKRYGDMRLYLRSQAEELARATWGTSEELLLEKERRSEERLKKADHKRTLQSGTPEEQILARCGGHGGAKSSKARKGKADAAGVGGVRAASAVVVAAAPRHTHIFLQKEEYCEATDMWTKRCACGFAVEYEKF